MSARTAGRGHNLGHQGSVCHRCTRTGADDEGAVGHAHREEELGLQRVGQLGLARRAFEELHRRQADAQARAQRGQADQRGHRQRQQVGSGHLVTPSHTVWRSQARGHQRPAAGGRRRARQPQRLQRREAQHGHDVQHHQSGAPGAGRRSYAVFRMVKWGYPQAIHRGCGV